MPLHHDEKSFDGSFFTVIFHRYPTVFFHRQGGTMSKAKVLKTVREKCLDCCCGSAKEVKLCTKGPEARLPCSLYPYRFGKDVEKRQLSDEAKAELALRLKNRSKTVHDKSDIPLRTGNQA